MSRRSFLQTLTSGSILLTTGCLSVGEEPGAFNFAIVNRREQRYTAEFTLRDDDDEVILDGSADIPERPPADGESSKLSFDDLVKVTNGDTIDVRIRIAGETFEETYEVTCNRSENAENNLVFHIRHPEAPTANEMEFRGSEC